MKTYHHISFILNTLFVGGALLAGACSDEWDNHYEGKDWQSSGNAPTLMELVNADADLAPFARVVKHVGYDRVLSSPQQLTLWAPVITSAQADSVIALYDSQRGKRDEYNTAITQFVQNHIALYGRSVSTAYKDSVRMMNGKYLVLTASDLSGVTFSKKNIVASNGIMYKLNGKEAFAANVRDYLDLAEGLDSVAAFFEQFDEYKLDETSSVQRGIVNGKIVYADSVMRLSNALHSSLGWINREDSSYIFLAPSNEVWANEYARFRPLFNYGSQQENRDSVADLNAHFAIIRGRVFNKNIQRSIEDSIYNTNYVNYRGYYGLNVFDRPYDAGGILNGLTPKACSNGLVYVDNEGRIDAKKTFLQPRYILASSARTRTTPQLYDANNEIKAAMNATVRSVATDTTMFKQQGLLKEENFLEVEPLVFTGNIKNGNSSMYFYLPYTFSNLYYNVYVVMVPASASTDAGSAPVQLPVRFQVYYNERLATPRTTGSKDSQGRDDANDDLGFKQPNQDAVLAVQDEAFKDDNRHYITTGTDVDVICIDRARKPELSYYNYFSSSVTPNKEAVMRYRLTTDVTARNLDKTQTNVMRINRIIYIPFETEEEAKAFELDLSNLKEYNTSL